MVGCQKEVTVASPYLLTASLQLFLTTHTHAQESHVCSIQHRSNAIRLYINNMVWSGTHIDSKQYQYSSSFGPAMILPIIRSATSPGLNILYSNKLA
jgi:hypothetical protein